MNFYIEAYGKYTNSIIILTLISFKGISSGRQLNIIGLIDISRRHLNFTIEKKRKQHISRFKGR